MEFTIQFVLSVISAILTGVVGFLVYKIKNRELTKDRTSQEILNREEAITESLRALCRDRILQGYRYYKRNNGVSTQDLETMTKLYNAYHNLRGNGTITAVYEKILQLPIIEGD